MVIGTFAGVALAVLGLAWFGQRALIYFPSDVVPSPGAVGVPDAETLTVTTDDGLELQAWYVPAAGETVGAVLMLHGNAGSRAGRGPLAAALRDRGLATLLLDYRGFGGNPGRPSQDGLLADARAGVAALRRRSGLETSRIVYFGESLGTAVAAGLAVEQPPAALILRSPFPSLAAVGRLHYPWLPVGLLLRDEFPTEEWLVDYDGPVLVVVGERDDIVPADLSSSVARAAGPGTEVVRIADAGHNDRALLDGARLLDAVSAFLRDRTQLPVRAAGA